MIVIEGLTKIYAGGVQALGGIDCTIGSGMFGLLGPNGAGKTTLMRIIAGILTPTAGSVTAFGHDLHTQQGKQVVHGLLGYLPQELGLHPNLSAREFLDYMAVLKGLTDRRTRQQQVDELLELVRLDDTGKRPLKAFSGGMKRRVGIAQALLGNPRLLIVDEPTVGLDPEERVRIRNLLAEMARRCTVILSTHVIEDIGHSCSNLAIINKGQVLFQGAPAELIERARGKVWSIQTTGDYPTSDLQVVSTLQLRDSIQYRVLGEPDASYQAQALEPGLEDGYMWMMNLQRHVS